MLDESKLPTSVILSEKKRKLLEEYGKCNRCLHIWDEDLGIHGKSCDCHVKEELTEVIKSQEVIMDMVNKC